MNLQELLADIIEHIRGSWRFRWRAALASWLICIGGGLYVLSIPDTYEASARVYVDTNSLIRPLMQGLTAPSNTIDEVYLFSSAVLSRPNLEQVARETDLYLRAQTPEELEVLITNLQRRISVFGRGDNTFTILYSDTSREQARAVVAAVLDNFVESAIGAGGDDTDVTERALAREIEDHEQRLRAAEARLADFKRDNLGYMPTEAGDYYGQLQAALNEQAATEARIRLLSERREELRRQLEGEEPVFGIMPSTLGSAAGGCSQSTSLAELQRQLSTLLVTYTDKHPRVLSLQETIATLEQRCAAESMTAASMGATGGLAPSNSLDTNPVYQNLRLQLSVADVELAEARALLRRNEEGVAQLRRDVDKITEVERELKQLDRDYGVVLSRHQELLRRWEDLQAKKRLDPVTDRVQFRRIEPPFAGVEPVGPNRPMLLAAVLLFAIGAGGALAFGLNQVNPVFFTRRSVQRQVDLPILGAVSMLLTPREQAQRRSEAIVWVGSYLLLIAGIAAVMMYAMPAARLYRSLATMVGI